MTYTDQFHTTLKPFFKAVDDKNSGSADAGLRLASSVMAVFKVLRDLSTKTKSLPDDFRQNAITAFSEIIAVWPNDPVMSMYNGRYWTLLQLALSDWLESPVHQVKAEEAPDSTEKVKKQVRAVSLQETAYSVVVDIARFTGVTPPDDAEYGIRLREAIDKTFRE